MSSAWPVRPWGISGFHASRDPGAAGPAPAACPWGRGPRIDEDAVGRQFLCQGLGEAEDAGLGRRVGRAQGATRDSVVGRGVDDAAALLLHHQRSHLAAEEERPFQVDVQDLAPLGPGKVLHRFRVDGAARQVGKDVDGSEVLANGRHHVLDLRCPGHVDGVGPGLRSRGGQLARHPVGALPIRVSDGDGNARPGEPQRDATADAVGAAANNGHVAQWSLLPC